MRIVSFERSAPRTREAEPSPGTEVLGAAGFALDGIGSAALGARRFRALISAGPDAGAVVDLSRALAVKLALDDAGAPEAEAESLIPSEPLAFVARSPRALAAARGALGFVREALERYDAPDLAPPGSCWRAVRCASSAGGAPGEDHRRGAQLRRPRARARRHRAAEEPVLFIKASSAVIGPRTRSSPRAVQQADYEGELAVVIGPTAQRVSARRRRLGRRILRRERRHRARLSGRARTALPRQIVRHVRAARSRARHRGRDQRPARSGLVTRLSGEVVQSARTKDMHFPIADVIAFASRLMRLEPGDVILTGTPGGVGAARDPARWLRDGDVVEVEIERVGRLVNYVRAER